jgi:BolA protein
MSRQQRITDLINQHIKPIYSNIEDESDQHHVPTGSESHFKITLVADLFQPLSRLERHRLINKILANELQQGLHALSLHLYSPTEWEAGQKKVINSPVCRGGLHREHVVKNYSHDS